MEDSSRDNPMRSAVYFSKNKQQAPQDLNVQNEPLLPHSPLESSDLTDAAQNYGGVEDECAEDDAESFIISTDDIVPRNKRADHPTSNFQAFLHLVKGNLGTGLLALPFAISKVGYIFGPVLMIILGMIALHCMLLLVKCSHALCYRFDKITLDYGQVAEVAFWEFRFKKKIGPYTINQFKAGYIAKGVVNLFLIFTQFGFCSVYFVFMGSNLQQVFNACGLELDDRVWILILIPMVAIFCWIRNLDALAPLSAVANLCIIFGLVVILYYCTYLIGEGKAAANGRDGGVDAIVLGGTAIPVFFGNAVYAFEGIGVVLPLENKMKNPSSFKWVVSIAMVMITLLYAGFSTLGYLAFGADKIEDSITLNLPKDKDLHSVVYHITKLYLSYAIFVTYLVQFYVPMDFLEPTRFRSKTLKCDTTGKPKRTYLGQIVFRTILVVVTGVLAIAIPKLDLFISLIGAFSSSTLAIIFPPILQILVFYRANEPGWLKAWWICKSTAIIIIGLLGFITGTYVSVKNIVDYVSGE